MLWKRKRKWRNPILCIDFDGVVHSYTSGWDAIHVIADPPVPGAIKALLDYMQAGYDVAIYSARSSSIRGRRAMKMWLKNALYDYWLHGGSHPILDDCECGMDVRQLTSRFKWPWFKPMAVLTIDDRAFHFTGTFPPVSFIREFKPWNKK
jgi:hypothetical protein